MYNKVFFLVQFSDMLIGIQFTDIAMALAGFYSILAPSCQCLSILFSLLAAVLLSPAGRSHHFVVGNWYLSTDLQYLNTIILLRANISLIQKASHTIFYNLTITYQKSSMIGILLDNLKRFRIYKRKKENGGSICEEN
ncbi:hypothetical protein ACJX0J_032831 [Zea mays]